jgi:hypothetical protein
MIDSWFWLIFHWALAIVAIVWAGRWIWEKFKDMVRPGL